MKEKTIVSWSGGKDSTLALYEICRQYEVRALLTTVTEGYDRVSMHGVRRALLERQARALGYPLEIVTISPQGSNEEYETRMRAVLQKHLAEGVSSVVFGDIFLEDVRRYREDRLLTVGLKGVFPLWGRTSTELAQRFIDLGFRAVICCVDTQQIGKAFAGRLYDRRFLAELPAGADPCGERGEFHSFVYSGPLFQQPVFWVPGRKILRDDRFYYCDLLPVG